MNETITMLSVFVLFNLPIILFLCIGLVFIIKWEFEAEKKIKISGEKENDIKKEAEKECKCDLTELKNKFIDCYVIKSKQEINLNQLRRFIKRSIKPKRWMIYIMFMTSLLILAGLNFYSVDYLVNKADKSDEVNVQNMADSLQIKCDQLEEDKYSLEKKYTDLLDLCQGKRLTRQQLDSLFQDMKNLRR